MSTVLTPFPFAAATPAVADAHRRTVHRPQARIEVRREIAALLDRRIDTRGGFR